MSFFTEAFQNPRHFRQYFDLVCFSLNLPHFAQWTLKDIFVCSSISYCSPIVSSDALYNGLYNPVILFLDPGFLLHPLW